MRRNVVNLYDVAKAAGVSKSTASLVLNNKIGNGFSVTDEVRDRILDVSRKLGYRPNLIAQSLSKLNREMIHILGGSHALHDFGDIYQTAVNKIVSMIDAGFEDYNITVDMSLHHENKSELPPWHVSAAVILARCNPATVEDLERTNIPYIVINGPAGKLGSQVLPDDVNGMKLAIKYFVELGHKRIAYAGPECVAVDYWWAESNVVPIPAFLKGHSSVYDRHQTYLEQMKAYGLTPMSGHERLPSTEKTDKNLNDSEEKAYKDLHNSAVRYIKKTVLQDKATAIIVYGHMEALNLLQIAQALNISVPEQLSIICFCDKHACNIMSPSMSFIDLMSEEMGQAAAELLIRQLEHSELISPQIIKLPERLIVRGTTSKPPND
ncbi:MAG: LacI family DNA-binding transcriptional regulator [Phycisphaerae bacterium]|jgi:LacI family transcriptional regulator